MKHLKKCHHIVLHIWFLALGLLITGCAGQDVRVHANSGAKLSNYKTVLVEFTTKVPDSNEQLDQLESMVISKVKREGWFEKVLSASGNPDSKTDLTLKADLIELVKVSGAARFWGGAFAGRAKAVMSVKLVDNSSGNLLSEFQAEGKTGAWAFAGSTDQALNLTAQQIVDFIKKNL